MDASLLVVNVQTKPCTKKFLYQILLPGPAGNLNNETQVKVN